MKQDELNKKESLLNDAKDGMRIYYTEGMYCEIYEMDIRFYIDIDNKKKSIMTINTYPTNPREVLKLIDFIE